MTRLEALPRPTVRRWRPARATVDERPGPRDVTPGSVRERSRERPARLPSNLVGLTILVVDDDPDALDVFAVALRACGAAVVTAASARDALALMADLRPDAVLSDIAMQDGDGYWLVREIRGLADPALSRLPVVAATAFGREHSRERVLAGGFVDHLQKPVDPDTLCRSIGRAAGR